MKRIQFIIWLIILSYGFAKAQSYPINSYNGQTVTSCTGTFYDSGGASGNYAANQTYTVTFAPATSGTYANMTFTLFTVGIGDMLEVFDGATVNAPLIGIFNNGNSPVGITLRPSLFNIGGKLTFRWTSVTAGVGWAANVSCGIPCQNFNSILTSSSPPFTLDSGIYFIDICPGDTVSLIASASFPFNNFFYHQDTTTTTFSWNFGGATTVNGQNVTTSFTNIQGYNAYIIAEDTNGCFSSQTTEVRIRVSTPPVFVGTDVSDDTICQFESTSLNGLVTPTHWQIVPSLSVAGTTYLPDGSGVSYTSNLVFSGFGTGQTLQQASDILQVFAEIEHSYLGDLNITLTCPNNSTITLKSYPGGTSTFLGEPIDNNSAQIAGLGYMYHWKSTGTTTMLNAAGTYTHSFTDVLGNSYTNHAYLPPSTVYPTTSTASAPFTIISYLPETPFTNLVGCPLNGSWSITVTDNLMIDNGFIFSWGIDFDPSILPVAWGYTPVVDTTHWNIGIGDTTNYLALTPGNQNMTYTMIDGAGCVYDTIVDIYVKPAPVINLGNDTSICFNDMLTINSGSTLAGTSFVWSNGGTNANTTIQANSTQTYFLTATSNQGCIAVDSVEIIANPLPQIILSQDTQICIGTQASIFASGGDIYAWNNGMNSPAIIVSPNNSQQYIVTVTDSMHCVNDSSMFVAVVPLPQIITSNDTTICDATSANIWAKGGINYLWDNGVQASYQTVSPVSDKAFKVIVTDTNSCVDSTDILVQIIAIPMAEIFSDYDTICKGGTVSLAGNGAMSYKWNNGPNTKNYSVIPTESTTYYLKAINTQNGTECYDTTSYFVLVEQCALYIPSAFTPNGDGLNDTYGPKGIVSNNAYYEFLIYDRWGKLAFRTNDRYEQWDGKVDYIDAPDGVYTYVIRVSESSIQPYEISGTVTLYR